MYRQDRGNAGAVERAGAAQQRADEDAARARRGAVGNVAPDQLGAGCCYIWLLLYMTAAIYDAARARRGAVGNVAADQLGEGAGARDGRHSSCHIQTL